MSFIATFHAIADSQDAAIIARAIQSEEADLPEDSAGAVLRLFRLDASGVDRMHELGVENQA